ncbi:hypothetical protein IJG22_00780 [Candidatus Saccharibacteria bacterium]|nr:hypothetical protein [Candidatus Saccharibacteria bacterium]
MFEPRKREMKLEDYLVETNQPTEHFAEDSDYIIFCNHPASKLQIIIEKKAYFAGAFEQLFTDRPQHQRKRFFNIMKVKYRLPYLPGNSDTDILLGKYFLSRRGPCFLLCEPKDATHALFTNTPFSFYWQSKTHNPINITVESFEDTCYQVFPLDSVFEWIGKFMYIAKSQLEWERIHFMKKCQIEFYRQLEKFYNFE